MTIFIDKKTNNNEYINIFLKDDSEQNSKIIFAKKGYLVGSNSNRRLRLLNGKFINVNYEGRNTYFDFEQTDFNLSKFGTKTITTQKIKETPLLNLLKCVFYFSIKKNTIYNSIKCNAGSIKEISSEVYSRVFKPLNLFLLSAIVIFVLMTNYEKKNFKLNQIIIFLIGVMIVFFFEIVTDYSGKSNINMLVSITLPIIIFLCLYFTFYQKNIHNNTTK